MNWFDYFLIALALFSCVIGIVRGFVRELISLLTWILAIWFAWDYGPMLEPHLGGVLAEDSVRTWAARGLIFIGVVLVGTAIGALVKHYMRMSVFRGLDRLGGAVFGVLRSLVIIGLIVMLCHALRLTGEPWWRDAMLRPPAEKAANVLRSMVGERKISVVKRAFDFVSG